MTIKPIVLALVVLAANPLWAQHANGNFTPGASIQILAHNAYPDHGKYADRLDRAIASGMPFTVEEDLARLDGKHVVIHGAKNASVGDPTLESSFFPKVEPFMEKALQDGDKSKWRLITLYLDIKNDPPEHFQAISDVLDKYNAWLTAAEKTEKPLSGSSSLPTISNLNPFDGQNQPTRYWPPSLTSPQPLSTLTQPRPLQEINDSED